MLRNNHASAAARVMVSITHRLDLNTSLPGCPLIVVVEQAADFEIGKNVARLEKLVVTLGKCVQCV